MGIYLKKHGMSKKLLIFIFLILFAITILFITDSALQHRLQSLLAGQSSHRGEIWFFTLEQIKENPLLGYGVNTFKTLTANSGVNRFAGIHNMILEMLLYLGIVGLAIFLYLLWNIFKTGIQNKRILYVLILASYLVLLQFDGSLIDSKVHINIFILMIFFTVVSSERILKHKYS
jgi:O-antigen ligase